MKCVKCGKDCGEGPNAMSGIVFERDYCDSVSTQETIDYYNRQLGKHSNGHGGCAVELCLECYLDMGYFAIAQSITPMLH